MKKILKVLKKRVILYVLIMKVRIIVLIKGKENIFFLLGTPRHGNIGDQAITLAETFFLKDSFGKTVVEIPSQYILFFENKWHSLIGDAQVLVHGGGFVGSLWPEEDEMLKKVLLNFKDNNIVILPQTIFYAEENVDIINKDRNLFNSCKNLTFCLRERYSYEFALKYGFHNVELMPDMVTYLKKDMLRIRNSSKKSYILLCLRDDCEKVTTDYMLKEILNLICKYKYKYTDTFVKKTIYPFNRKVNIEKKISEFTKAKLVITDRLHGMVFAAIAGTPCVVMPNCNYKIKGVYEWIANNENIIFVENIHGVNQILKKLLTKHPLEYDNSQVMPYFQKLKKIIRGDKL